MDAEAGRRRSCTPHFGSKPLPVRHCGATPSRGGGTRTPDLRFWRPPLYQLSYAPELVSDCSRVPFAILSRVGQRRALGALFLLLALAFAGIAFAALVSNAGVGVRIV